MTDAAAPARATRLRELAWLFARLGFTGFGGPAAHIAMMEDEVVRRRGWMTRERLLDLIGAANLIPGPTSTELAIHIGHDRAGWPAGLPDSREDGDVAFAFERSFDHGTLGACSMRAE